jgi:hemerythrin superfamily protein
MQKVLSANDPITTAEEHYPAIRKKLLVHARAEQAVLYTACEKRAETASMISTSIGEHAELERLIGQLDSLPVDSQAFLEEFRRLEQTVRHHVEQEENLLFDRCQEAFEGTDLRDLEREYDDAKTLIEDELTDAPMMRRTASVHPPTYP